MKRWISFWGIPCAGGFLHDGTPTSCQRTCRVRGTIKSGQVGFWHIEERKGSKATLMLNLNGSMNGLLKVHVRWHLTARRSHVLVQQANVDSGLWQSRQSESNSSTITCSPNPIFVHWCYLLCSWLTLSKYVRVTDFMKSQISIQSESEWFESCKVILMQRLNH